MTTSPPPPTAEQSLRAMVAEARAGSNAVLATLLGTTSTADNEGT